MSAQQDARDELIRRFLHHPNASTWVAVPETTRPDPGITEVNPDRKTIRSVIKSLFAGAVRTMREDTPDA